MNELSALEKTPSQNSYYEDKQNIPSQKSQNKSKTQRVAPRANKKKQQLKMLSFPFYSSILKKKPEQILTAVAVRVLIVDISKSFLNHLLWYKSWECHLTTFYSSPAVVGNKIMHNAHNRTNVSFQVFFSEERSSLVFKHQYIIETWCTFLLLQES